MYRDYILEIFKIRMFKLLGENGSSNESFIEKSIIGLGSKDLKRMMDKSFLIQTENMDKRMKLLTTLFHKEINDPWLTTFSSCFTSHDELQKINPELAVKLQSGTLDYSTIFKAFYYWVDDNGFFDKKPMCAKNKAKEELNVWVELFKDYFSYVEALYDKITPVAEKMWNSKLTKFEEDDVLKDYNLVVSMGEADWFRRRNDVISASYITKEHNKTYLEDRRKFGWCFSVNAQNLIGMCPYDFNSSLLDDYEITSLELYKAAFAGAEFSEQLRCFRTSFAEFLRWYKPDDLLDNMKENDYNEILFKGNSRYAVPTAVFVKCPDTDDQTLTQSSDFKRASTVANLYKLPLVIFNECNKTIRIITKPEIVA